MINIAFGAYVLALSELVPGVRVLVSGGGSGGLSIPVGRQGAEEMRLGGIA